MDETACLRFGPGPQTATSGLGSTVPAAGATGRKSISIIKVLVLLMVPVIC